MGKEAKTVENQINLLKDRGLIIDNETKCREYLLDIGYYRLGFYWYYFQDSSSHEFHNNIHLEDVVKLYYFDFDLKNLLAKYILRIEVHFRTQIVYYASNHYKDNPQWFSNNMNTNEDFVRSFSKIYRNIRKNIKIIQKHHKKYPDDNYAPAWKTFEFLTFGQILTVYKNISDTDLKNEIANVYDLRDYNLLENYLFAIKAVRNICSHNGVLFDFNQSKGIRRIPNRHYRNKTQDQNCLNTSFRVLLFILSKISQNRANDLENELKSLIDSQKDNALIKQMIETKIKFDL